MCECVCEKEECKVYVKIDEKISRLIRLIDSNENQSERTATVLRDVRKSDRH